MFLLFYIISTIYKIVNKYKINKYENLIYLKGKKNANDSNRVYADHHVYPIITHIWCSETDALNHIKLKFLKCINIMYVRMCSNTFILSPILILNRIENF